MAKLTKFEMPTIFRKLWNFVTYAVCTQKASIVDIFLNYSWDDLYRIDTVVGESESKYLPV